VDVQGRDKRKDKKKRKIEYKEARCVGDYETGDSKMYQSAVVPFRIIMKTEAFQLSRRAVLFSSYSDLGFHNS
jgi:hypothetical protein